MKKTLIWIVGLTAAVMLSACTPSNISSAERDTAPAGAVATEPASTMSIKDKPTVEYSIPADAPTGVNGGPGMMETTAVDDSYYPEEKQSKEVESAGSVICLYEMTDIGVVQSMAEVSEISADSIIAAMVEEGILSETTRVDSYDASGDVPVIELNELSPVYEKATEEQILACIGNSLIENLDLESVDIRVDGEDYGTLNYTDEYNAT